MTVEELYKILSEPSETENIEFKEAKEQFSILGKDGQNRKSLYGYCVAIGNEGGGFLILGVTNAINPATGRRDIIGTRAIQNTNTAREAIYKFLGRKIEIQEIITPSGKVQVIKIPAHPVGSVFEFYDVPLMRNNENLVSMDKGTLTKILTETHGDFSAEINLLATINDIDTEAAVVLKERFIEKSGNNDFGKLSEIEILQKLLLICDNKITNACLLLVGKEDSLVRLIPNHEVFLEWRSDPKKLEYDNRQTIRKPYLLADDEIWNYVNARNIRTALKQGFFELDIWAYDKDSIREAVLNAFAHREYRNRTEPIYVRMFPEKIIIKNAGGFVAGVSVENVLDAEGKWRNPFLMDILNRIGLVERAGIGLDRIYEKTISDGKGLPTFDGTDNEQVVLNIPAKIRDLNFVYYLEKISKEKQLNLGVKDFIELEKIRETDMADNKDRLKYFLKNYIIEKINKGRGTKYILARDFYEFIERKSEYTRKRWLNKDEQKQIILNYLRQHKKGQISDFKQLFKERELNNKQINNLLKGLYSEGVYFDGRERSKSAFWKIR